MEMKLCLLNTVTRYPGCPVGSDSLKVTGACRHTGMTCFIGSYRALTLDLMITAAPPWRMLLVDTLAVATVQRTLAATA